MTYDVASRDLTEQTTLVVRARVPVEQVSQWLPQVYQEVFGLLARQGAQPVGPPFARYVMHPDAFEVEAGAPVVGPVTPEGRVVPGTLPGGPAAVTTHTGAYEELGGALDALTAWVAEHGAEPAGAHWEVYFSDPQAEPDPSRWRTDVVLPYRPANGG